MAKQICFFATQKDVELLLHNIYALGAIVIDYKGTPLTNNTLPTVSFDNLQAGREHNNYLITKPGLSLVFRTSSQTSEIDQVASEVIEFNVCRPIPKKIIDTSSVDKEFQRGGIVVIDDTERYNQLMKKLMLNPPYIENPNYVEYGFDHGRFWYASECLSIDGEKQNKSEELGVLFSNLRKYIKTNFILSKDKFAYIGPNAYKMYRSGTFVPCSGKNRIII